MKKYAHLSFTLLHKKNTVRFIIVCLIAVPFLYALISIIQNGVNIWYDNARDLLSGVGNLHKLTLIGPTTGIPGIFYGPYWIWLLSLGLLFSRDPRVITIITATLPYCILFPILWFRFSKYLGIKALSIAWILFIFSSGLTYATGLWNPYPSALLAVSCLYLLLSLDFVQYSRRNLFLYLLLGFLLGLLINFSFSFGAGFFAGAITYLVLILYFEKKGIGKKIRGILLSRLFVLFGSIIAFLPFLLFELRHGKGQLLVILNAFFKFGNVVQTSGLSKQQILEQFPATLGTLLHIDPLISVALVVAAIFYYLYAVVTKKIVNTPIDAKFCLLILSLLLCISTLYFSARNPIWAYHFIGVESIFLLLIAFLASKVRWFFYVTILLCVVAFYQDTLTYLYTSLLPHTSYFSVQQNTVNTVISDAGANEYSVIAYTPSIYMYEYSYFFKWLGNKDIPYDPGLDSRSARIIYLIIPNKQTPLTIDFIHFRTPGAYYKTERTWILPGNTILKRVRPAT